MARVTERGAREAGSVRSLGEGPAKKEPRVEAKGTEWDIGKLLAGQRPEDAGEGDSEGFGDEFEAIGSGLVTSPLPLPSRTLGDPSLSGEVVQGHALGEAPGAYSLGKRDLTVHKLRVSPLHSGGKKKGSEATHSAVYEEAMLKKPRGPGLLEVAIPHDWWVALLKKKLKEMEASDGKRRGPREIAREIGSPESYKSIANILNGETKLASEFVPMMAREYDVRHDIRPELQEWLEAGERILTVYGPNGVRAGLRAVFEAMGVVRGK